MAGGVMHSGLIGLHMKGALPEKSRNLGTG